MATTTTHDEGFHEIQLNGKQLVFLFMAGTVVAVVIFLCGVLVGRGVQLTPAGLDSLSSDAAIEPAPAPDAPAVPLGSGSEAPASSKEQLQYPERLTAAQPGREVLNAKPSPPPPAPASNAAAAPVAAAPVPAPAPADDVRTEPAGQGYSIQLTALSERREAESIARRLAGKGYSAYVVAPAAGTPGVFRVRVGKFKELREAESVSTRLKKEEQFKPWIVR
jgi:DedD protein